MTAIMPLTSHKSERWPTGVIALVAARSINALGAFALAFLAVVLVEDHGASLATAGWVVASFGLATIPSRLIGGWLADRFGRRPTVVAGLIGCVASLLVIAASPGVTGALIGAVLLGCAFEIYEPPSQALLAELVPARRRAQAFGMLGAALAVAGVVAGILAVVLGGVDLRLLFVADAVTCLAAAVLVLVFVRDPGTGRSSRTHRGRNPWVDTRLLTMLAVGTGSALVWSISVTSLPLTVSGRGFDPALTGWLLAVSAVATVFGQRFLKDGSTRPFALMARGLVLVAIGYTVIALVPVLPFIGLGCAVTSLGNVFLLGPPFAVVAGLAGSASRASYLAAFGTSWGIAQTVGPIVATRLLAVDVSIPWLAGAAFALVLASAMPLATRIVHGS